MYHFSRKISSNDRKSVIEFFVVLTSAGASGSIWVCCPTSGAEFQERKEREREPVCWKNTSTTPRGIYSCGGLSFFLSPQATYLGWDFEHQHSPFRPAPDFSVLSSAWKGRSSSRNEKKKNSPLLKSHKTSPSYLIQVHTETQKWWHHLIIWYGNAHRQFLPWRFWTARVKKTERKKKRFSQFSFLVFFPLRSVMSVVAGQGELQP